MRSSEWVVCGYLACLVTLAWTLRLPGTRRAAATAVSAVLASLIFVLARRPQTSTIAFARDWLPAAYLVAGYWLSGLLFTRPMPRVEQWLQDIDRRIFERCRLSTFLQHAPRAVLEYFEASYVSCYAVVVAGLAVLSVSQSGVAADRYWTTVLLAEFGCYAMLPFIQTRPPRAIEGAGDMDRRRPSVRRLNLWILRFGSIQVNTVPSGHAAGGLATALLVAAARPAAGAAFLVLAFSIAAGSVVGRYHYAADAVLGLLWALIVWFVVG